MKTAFTICSVNYLAQAHILGDSLLKYNPDYQFIIGLVDDLSKANLPADKAPKYSYIQVSDLDIDGFDDMYDRYNITELNTAVKPFFFQYIYKNEPQTQTVIYLDPDIEVFAPFAVLDEKLITHSLVVTPHTVAPYPDDHTPNERDLLNTGIFNLGFLGTSRSTETEQFLAWWAKNLKLYCYINLEGGMFVDQNWVNFAPVFWNNTFILKHLGYNVAYWNLHDRQVSYSNNKAILNNTDELVFFHYSGFSPKKPELISKYQTRYSFKNRPDIQKLFDGYGMQLEQQHYSYYQTIPCSYIKPPAPWVPPARGQRPRRWLKKQLEWVISKLDVAPSN